MQKSSECLLRMPQVLLKYPVSAAAWRAGVASGRFPKSVKIGPRAVAWRESEIDQLIANAR